MGASFIIKDNQNMMNLINEYGLTLFDPTKDKILGIVSQNRLQTYLEPGDFSKAKTLLWRYGFSIIKLFWK